MKKIVLFVSLFYFVCGIAQEKVVNKNGKEITVQNPLTNPVTGTGTVNFLSKFNGTSTLTNSQLFDNGTNVGIGTTTPLAKFHLEGTTAGSSSASGSGSLLWVKQNATWGMAAPYALWVDGYSYLNGFRINAADGQRSLFNSIANSELGFGTNGGDITFSFNLGTTRGMTFKNSNGYVGIGTTSPNTRLEVSSGTAGSSGLRFTNLTNSTAGASTFSGLLGVNASGDVGIGTVTGSSLSGFTAGQVTFGSSTGTLAQSSNFFWDNTNNRLGIGTSTPITSFSNSSSSTNFLGSDGLGMVSNAFTWGAGTAGWGAGIINGNSLAGCNGLLVKVANNTSSTRVLEIGQGTTTTTPLFDVLGNGYIGIGTNAPISQFANTNAIISGNASNNAISGGLTWSTPGTGFSGSFYNSATNGNGMLVKINGTASTQTAFEVLSGTTAATVSNTHFRILGNGNIGVGTSTPNTKLELASGTAGSSGLRFTNLTNSTAGSSTFSGVLGVNATGDVGIGTVSGSSLSGFTAGQVTFGSATGTLTQSSNLFWDGTNNKLGIGTTTPIGQLSNTSTTISGSNGMGLGGNALAWAGAPSTWLGAFYNSNTGTTAHGLNVKIAGTTATNYAFEVGVGAAANTSSTPLFDVLGNGNVGIGTNAPSQKLVVKGVNAQPAATGTVSNATFRIESSSNHALDMGTLNDSPYGSYIQSTDKTNLASSLPLILNPVSGRVGIGTTNPISLLANTSANIIAKNTQGTSTNSLAWIHSGPGFAAAINNPDGTGHGLNVKVGGTGIGTTAFEVGTGATSTASTPLFNVMGNGWVGLGTASPNGALMLYGNTTILSSQNTDATKEIVFGRGGSTTGASAISGYDAGSFGGGLSFYTKANNSMNTFPTGAVESMRLTATGRLGIGVINPTSTFEVNGAATNTTAFNAGAGTSIDFSRSNLAYTTASAGAFTLNNMKDGGTYTLAVQGATSGTSTFTAGSLTVKYINNGATAASKHTLYTFIVMGTTVYVYMATGF